MEAELGARLIAELDERLQPARLAASDPLTRPANAATLVLRYLAAEPARGLLAARAAADIPGVSQAVHVRMREDLAARIVSAIFMQAARDLGLGWIDATMVPHGESTFPQSREILAGVPEAARLTAPA